MNHEHVPPHHLAASIAATELQGGQEQLHLLGRTLDQSQRVWRELKNGQFETNEHGHLTFVVEDVSSDYRTEPNDHVDGIRVLFHDPQGGTISLGGIRRVPERPTMGQAYVHNLAEQTEPLLPTDERWDAIVGSIQRAISGCIAQKEQQ